MSRLWRLCFLLAGVLILAGGPLHPGGTMAEMLAHPDWVLSHALMTAAFVLLCAGLALYRRGVPVASRSERWSRLALYGTILQTVEMVLHTAAVVDQPNLVAGRATPVLTAHLWLAVVAYPVFGGTFIGFIVATSRDRVLGSRWIAWLGILGAACHGLAAPIVILFESELARVLFPMVMFLALWLFLAAVWPLRAIAKGPVAETA